MARNKNDDGGHTIYHSTFTLHRLSPLHVLSGQEFAASSSALEVYARRFAEALKGSPLFAGSLTGEIEDGDTSRMGALRRCHWAHIPQRDDENNAKATVDGYGVMDGIRVDVEYENATYVALLLKATQDQQNMSGQVYKLPLLMSRMVAPIRSVLLDFLAVNFDTRAEPLHFTSAFITDTLDNFIRYLSEGEEAVEGIIKDVQMSIGFKMPIQASLRTLDVTIRREDIKGFLARGKTLDLDSAKDAKSMKGPFTVALREYFTSHLAMSLEHSQIFISRVACGAFALGREGKIKLFKPPSIDGEMTAPTTPLEVAMTNFLRSLISTASSEG